MASIHGVNGWYSANHASPGGMQSVGTNPLPRNGRRIRSIGVLLAVSTLLAEMPSSTLSQVSASEMVRTSTATGEPWMRSRPCR